MTTQSIVVYTPVENALYNGGMMIPLIGGLGAGFIVFILLMKFAERIFGWNRMPDLVTIGAAIVAVCAGALTFHWLMI